MHSGSEKLAHDIRANRGFRRPEYRSTCKSSLKFSFLASALFYSSLTTHFVEETKEGISSLLFLSHLQVCQSHS